MADLVNTKNFPGRALAEQAQDILQKEGIHSIIQGDDVGLFGARLPAYVQGVNPMVKKEDYEKARELLEALYNGI